jgi:hypothetical protein
MSLTVSGLKRVVVATERLLLVLAHGVAYERDKRLTVG